MGDYNFALSWQILLNFSALLYAEGEELEDRDGMTEFFQSFIPKRIL